MQSKRINKQRLMRMLYKNKLSRDEIEKRLDIDKNELSELLDTLIDFEMIVFENDLYSLNVNTVMEMKEVFTEFEEETYSTRKQLMEGFVQRREDTIKRMPIETEFAYYNNVSDGNIEMLNYLYVPIGGEGSGKLSNDNLQNLKYHMVISTAIIARFCMNKGMSMEESYSISDMYIQKADACTKEDDVKKLHYEMSMVYAKRMGRLKFKGTYSIIMIKIMDYISSHLHERILIQDIADHVSRSVPYVSRLFSTEIGMSASKYIMKMKIEAAAEMLLLTEKSISDIAALYGFSTSSHFTMRFKDEMGVSPKEFRRKFASVAWAKGNKKRMAKDN